MARVIFNGQPGEVWQNGTGKVQYQLIVSWHNSCGQCIQFDHAIGPYWGIPLHRSCRCRQVVIAPGAQAQPYVDFMAEIDKLPEARQSLVIGASNLKLVKAGVVQWGDVVTSTRIRDLREVVARQKLSVETMTRAGVRKDLAEKAHASVHTPAHQLAEQTRKELIDKLLNAGLTREQIDKAVAERLARRVTIGTGPSGGMGFAKVPTTPKPPPKPAPAAPAKATPAGTPVSRAINNTLGGDLRAQAKSALKAIDEVHGDGRLPIVKLEVTTDPDLNGQIAFNRAGTPVAMRLSPTGPTPHLTLAHETGHLLDAAGVPRGAMPKNVDRDYATDPELKAWHRAVMSSQAVRTLEAMKNTSTDTAVMHGVRASIDRGYVSHLLQGDELWARSYAQYIATESQHPEMLAELNGVRDAVHMVNYPKHWADDDFRPIAAAIEALFRRLGWRK